MRIAHLLRKYNPAEWGGTESVIQQLFSGLQREGVESVVYCPKLPHGANPTVPDPLAAVGCTVRRFNACVPIWGISAEQRQQMIAVGGNLMSFDLIRSLWTASQSVIHSHALGRIGGIGLTVARRKHIPFVVTVHGGAYDLPESLRQSFDQASKRGWEWGRPFGLLLRSRQALAEADAIVTCNRREADLISLRHPDRRVIVQPHGVAAEIYDQDRRTAARAAFPQIRDRTVLLCVGRIDPVKNQGFLIDQVPELIRRYPGALLVLAGSCTDEAYGAELRERIRQRDLAHHVLFTGKLPPADPRLIGLMQEARVVVLPSISETFGLVILEAWAAGTPVVSSRTSGASALLEDGRNGWLFDLDRAEGFFHALDATLLDKATCLHATVSARQRVVADFDTRVLASRMRRLYENLQEESRALHPHS